MFHAQPLPQNKRKVPIPATYGVNQYCFAIGLTGIYLHVSSCVVPVSNIIVNVVFELTTII